MPFKSNEELERKVPGTKKLSDKQKTQWRAVFDSCFKDKGDDKSCYAIAYGAVKRSASDQMVVRELVAISRLLAEEDDQSVTASFFTDVKAVKMRMAARKFFSEAVKFKGMINGFVEFMADQVNNKDSLKEFPEFRDILDFSNQMRIMLAGARLSESEIGERMNRVVCKDAGTC